MLKLQFDQEAFPAVDLTKPRISVGREPQNDVVLPLEGISSFHAEIYVDDGKIALVDLGSTNGTFVNGRRVSGRVALSVSDKLRFDTLEAQVVDTERQKTQLNPQVSPAPEGSERSDKTQVRQIIIGWVLKGVAEPVKNRVIALTGKKIIGRDDACDVVIDDHMISSRHASIEVTGDNVKVTDLDSTNGTFVNGRRITEAELKNGDEVRFDQIAFRVEGPPEEIAAKTTLRPAAALAFLTGAAGRLAGKTFPLTGARIAVGRTPDNAIVVDDETVSSAHAVMIFSDGDWTLEDQGSTNGTFVNNRRVTRQRLQNGDRIRFGNVTLSFDAPSAGGVDSTRVMSAVEPQKTDRTMVMPSAAPKGWPAWTYGLIGFALVAIVAAVLFALGIVGGKSGASGVKLQAARLWTVETTHPSPVTPILADINGDGFLDVVVAGGDGIVLTLDGAEGKRVFEFDIAGRILAPPVTGDLTGNGQPDMVIAAAHGVVTALNGKGQMLWRSAADLNLGEILNRPVVARINDDAAFDVIVPTTGRGLVALDGSRGWLLWDTASMTRGKMMTTPVVADINGDGVTDIVGLTDAGQVLAVTNRDGKVWQLWEASVTSVFYASPLFIRAGKQPLVVVATDGGGVTALNGENGRMVWFAKIEKRFFASPVGADANGDGVTDVIVASVKGDIHVLDGRTGDELWNTALNVDLQASPALCDLNSDGLAELIILDGSGNLRVLDMSRGREMLRLTVNPEEPFIASPVLGDINNDRLLNIVAAGSKGRISAISLNVTTEKGKALWPVFLGNDRHGW